MNILGRCIRFLTKRWWQHEISVCDGLIKLQELSATPDGITMHIEKNPELSEYIGAAFVKMLKDAPNYAEMSFSTCGKDKDSTVAFTVTVQRCYGKTPHQLRIEAEEKLESAKKRLEWMSSQLYSSTNLEHTDE